MDIGDRAAWVRVLFGEALLAGGLVYTNALSGSARGLGARAAAGSLQSIPKDWAGSSLHTPN